MRVLPAYNMHRLHRIELNMQTTKAAHMIQIRYRRRLTDQYLVHIKATCTYEPNVHTHPTTHV